MKWRKEEKNDYALVVTKKWAKGNKCQETKLFSLENNDEEEMEAFVQRDEEEILKLKYN